jgi:hypothetical protein
VINIQESKNLKTFAHIVEGRVVNVSLWDGETPYNPSQELIEIPEGSHAGIGWDYANGDFTDNRPEPVEIAE